MGKLGIGAGVKLVGIIHGAVRRWFRERVPRRRVLGRTEKATTFKGGKGLELKVD